MLRVPGQLLLILLLIHEAEEAMDLTLMAFGVKGGTPFISLVLQGCLNLILKLLREDSSGLI